MIIQAYFNRINSLVDRYVATDAVLDANVNFDLRPAEQGYISGIITFKDGSSLHFREFLDVVAEEIEKVMYTYHYQNVNQSVIFRYDNAAHKPALALRDHKHLASGEIEENLAPPNLADVLAEIVMLQGWL